MNSGVIIAIISAAGSIVMAALTYYFTRRHQINIEWRREKIKHYKILLAALSDVVVTSKDKRKAGEDFSHAANTIVLVAPQHVVRALMNFHNEVKWSNPNKTQEQHDLLLKKLLLAIRKDIGHSDSFETYDFHLIGAPPK